MFVRMQREYAGQFEFESAGAESRDQRGMTKKKRPTTKESKKKRGTLKGDSEPMRQQPQEVATGEEPPPSISPIRSTSPQEPGYQTIANATGAARTQPSAVPLPQTGIIPIII